MESDTPRTDAEEVVYCEDEMCVPSSFSRQLERELAAERATTAPLLRTIALIREAGGFKRDGLAALPDAVKAMREQRDEARIRVCELCARMGGVYRRVDRKVVECRTPEEIAEVCGWDCFAKKEGGGA